MGDGSKDVERGRERGDAATRFFNGRSPASNSCHTETSSRLS